MIDDLIIKKVGSPRSRAEGGIPFRWKEGHLRELRGMEECLLLGGDGKHCKHFTHIHNCFG